MEYSKSMFEYWTEDDFASSFRKMLTLEQFRNEEMQALYQQYLVSGPAEYVKDMFESIGVVEADKKATMFYSVMFFYYSLYDGAKDKKRIKEQFEKRNEAEHDNEKDEILWEEGTISDLSGGGIRFHGNVECKKEDLVEIVLPLSLQSGIVPLSLYMKVVSCVHFEGSRVAYETRGEFLDINEKERETVIKYVFEEQRRRMRKE